MQIFELIKTTIINVFLNQLNFKRIIWQKIIIKQRDIVFNFDNIDKLNRSMSKQNRERQNRFSQQFNVDDFSFFQFYWLSFNYIFYQYQNFVYQNQKYQYSFFDEKNAQFVLSSFSRKKFLRLIFENESNSRN